MRFPRPSLVVALVAVAAAALPARAQNTEVVVDAATVSALDLRLRAFAAGLPAGERQALTDLMLRAAGAPADNPAGTMVRRVLYTPAGGSGIIVQDGRSGIIVQGGRTASTPDVRGSNRPGGKGGTVEIGPKQDDPRASRAGGLAIGPKQDDPAPPPPSLQQFATTLPPEQRAVLDWMLQRASLSRGAPAGALLANAPSLAQALGISPLAIGPKQDDPAPPPPSSGRWVLRF